MKKMVLLLLIVSGLNSIVFPQFKFPKNNFHELDDSTETVEVSVTSLIVAVTTYTFTRQYYY